VTSWWQGPTLSRQQSVLERAKPVLDRPPEWVRGRSDFGVAAPREVNVATQGRCDVIANQYRRRCQLNVGHDGMHAAYLSGMYVSWSGSRVLRWSAERPPPWLLYLPWAAGHQPLLPATPPSISFDSA
jgi:hypothetical protein